MRAIGISLVSVALTSVVIGNAYYQKKQFYPSVVYITKSNPSMAVIYIQAFILVLLAGKLMRKVFFGQLRTAEFEHLMERAWYAITETCLAFTVFRDDFNPKFVALFTLLLFLKSFHWLAEDRVDYMERSPVISWLFHLRALSLLLVLGSLDLYFVQHAYISTTTKGASVQLVFGFEYAILLTMIANIAIKYILHTIDANTETPWENKAVFLLYTELIMGLIKVILYVAFVLIMVKIYTLPLFAFRPMYYTVRNFKNAFNDVIMSRRAIHNMNTLYPDATPEELQAADNVCIICREEMYSASKKLPCNHIFHTVCLRSWFQRQQTCPTCRLNILRSTPTTQQQRPIPRVRVQPINLPNQFPNPFQRLFNQNMPNLNPQAPVGDAQNADRPPTQTASTTGQSTQPQQNMPPFGVPPFLPFPFMPFLNPHPTIPQNFKNLSLEELRTLEGNERDNVEARIQCLKNIQTMLDAAVLMMQQYSAAVAISSTMPMPTTTTFQATTTVNPDPTPSTSSADTNGDNKTEPQVANTATDNNIDTTNSDVPNSDHNSSGDVLTSNSTNSVNVDDELRKKRLQRFQQTDSTQ